MRAHRHFDKVTSFYIRPLANPVEHWLRFECSLVSLVLLIGYTTFKWTLKRGCHLPPIQVHEELSSRTTLFQVGGDDTGRLSVFTASCASSPRRHAKVNLLLYACLESPIWDDILLHTPSYLDDRNSTTSTEGREDAMETRGRKADVTEAWKRRRKRSWTLQAGTSAPDGRNFRPGPELPPILTGTSAHRNFRPSSAQVPKVRENNTGCYCEEMDDFRNLAGTWPELSARPELPASRTGTSAPDRNFRPA